MELKKLHDATLRKEYLSESDLSKYLYAHAKDFIELIEAAKRMRELQRGELPYDHQALSEAEAAFDAVLQPFEGDK